MRKLTRDEMLLMPLGTVYRAPYGDLMRKGANLGADDWMTLFVGASLNNETGEWSVEPDYWGREGYADGPYFVYEPKDILALLSMIVPALPED